MMDMWISFGDVFLLVFAINDKTTFEAIKGKYNRILKWKHNVKWPILLVGNKVDLENDREVTYADAKQLADSWGIEYMETSAKNNFNCKEAFEKLAQQIVKSKSSRPKSGSCCIIIWKKLLHKKYFIVIIKSFWKNILIILYFY